MSSVINTFVPRRPRLLAQVACSVWGTRYLPRRRSGFVSYRPRHMLMPHLFCHWQRGATQPPPAALPSLPARVTHRTKVGAATCRPCYTPHQSRGGNLPPVLHTASKPPSDEGAFGANNHLKQLDKPKFKTPTAAISRCCGCLYVHFNPDIGRLPWLRLRRRRQR